jgi:hypothetical protein
VAVLVSIARGHSACYPFTTVGAADGATITGERGAGYYLSVVEKVGEPAGTWAATAPPSLASTTGTRCGARTFAALLHDREHTLRDAELGTLRGLARTARQAAPMRRHAEARAETRAGLGRTAGWPGGQAVRHPAQLSIGQQLLADAYAEGAPQLAYEQAAALLGVGNRWSDSHAIGDLIVALAFTRAMVLAVASTAAY